MQPLEIMLASTVLACIVLPWRTPLRAILRALMLVTLGAYVAGEGARWQMTPLYAACAVVLFDWLRKDWPSVGLPQAERSARAPRTGLLALLVLPLVVAAVALAWVLPVFQLPAPTGPYAVGTRTLHVIDTQRAGGARELVVQVWYPAKTEGKHACYARASELKPMSRYRSVVMTNAFKDAPFADSAQAFPVLLFNPRWRGARTQDTFLAEDLASHGFVVVAVDHPGNAALVELGDGRVVKSEASDALDHVETSSAAAVEALWAKELSVWVADDRFVLDCLHTENHRPGGWLERHLDEERTAAFGHSFGGATAMALLGVDPRVRAGLNLDGWNFSAVTQRTGQPAMFVYAGSPSQVAPQTGVEGALDRDDDAAVEQSLARFGGYKAYVAGAQHLDFTDNGLFSPLKRLTYTGPIAGPRAREITRALVLAFFERTLKGSDAPLPAFAEVTAQIYPPPAAPTRAP